MSPRVATTRLAWGLCTITILGLIAAVTLGLLGGAEVRPGEAKSILDVVVSGAAAVAFAIAGVLVTGRQRRNPIGWILCVVGLGLALNLFSVEYATYALLTEPGSLPGGEAMLWMGEWIWVPTLLVGTFLLLLFPDGRPPSRRWRPVAWLAGVGIIGVGFHQAFSPGKVEEFRRDNPLGLEGIGGDVASALGASFFLVIVAVLASVASLVVRMRRARGDERQQLKWLASGAVVFFIGFNLPVPSLLGTFVGQVAVAGAVGVAILKYRLYDIDVVINRTLVYGALTATLAGAYLGSVLVLQLALSAITEGSSLAIAGSTLAVAALFRPARARIQGGVDHRFYRSKYDAARTLESFGARLRDEIELDSLNAELCAVVRQTMQPAHVSLWLREAGR